MLAGPVDPDARDHAAILVVDGLRDGRGLADIAEPGPGRAVVGEEESIVRIIGVGGQGADWEPSILPC